MRNMYDYAYEYEYQYHPERAGEMFAVVFASLWLAIMIGMTRIYAWKLPSAFFRSVYDRKADGEKRCMDGICTFLREHITTGIWQVRSD